MAAESGGKDDKNQSEFSASLKQFIASLEPALKEAGSVAAAEDYLTHLEATDENFHRFVIVLFYIIVVLVCIYEFISR